MKYILIQDVAFDIPAELGGGVVTYKTGNVVEGFIPDGGGAIIHVVHKTGKGDMVVSLPLEAVKEYAPEGGSKKWLYLGAALVLVYWYVNRDKKKKRQESIPGFSGVKKKKFEAPVEIELIKKKYKGFDLQERVYSNGHRVAIAMLGDDFMFGAASELEKTTALEKIKSKVDAYLNEKK